MAMGKQLKVKVKTNNIPSSDGFKRKSNEYLDSSRKNNDAVIMKLKPKMAASALDLLVIAILYRFY
jgi:hypothetical protein